MYDDSEIRVVKFSENDFNSFFIEMRKNPSFLLPKYSIFSFYAFYDGYCFCKSQNNVPDSEGDILFASFIEWMRDQFKIKTDMSWANLIFAHSSDERSALNYLFTLYDEFVCLKIDSDILPKS